MIKTVSILTAIMGLAAVSVTPVSAEEKSAKGEAELAQILDGYEAGEPVKCLHAIQRDRLHIIDDTALIFRDRQTFYVNRTSRPRLLDDSHLPVFKSIGGSQLCQRDRVELLDRFSGFPGPVVTLESFVPYTKIEDS